MSLFHRYLICCWICIFGLFSQTPQQYQRPFGIFEMIFKLARCIKTFNCFCYSNSTNVTAFITFNIDYFQAFRSFLHELSQNGPMIPCSCILNLNFLPFKIGYLNKMADILALSSYCWKRQFAKKRYLLLKQNSRFKNQNLLLELHQGHEELKIL